MSRPGTHRTAGLTTLKWRDVEVRVEAGPDKGASALLDAGPLLIGSGPDCQLRLSDKTVSLRHCELRRVGDAVVVRDLDSTNGVLLDGVRVTEARPQAGSHLKLGKTVLVLKQQTEREVVVSRKSSFGGLYGQSAVMRALFVQLEPIARSDAPLLIEGETGTGKDVAARAVHQGSARAQGPLVLFDCGAVAPNLLESELFGYAKGAFTGATTAREGLAASAEGGTLILDEVGELPFALQPKLLRLVELHEVRPVGANAAVTVDLRIIACTHRSLKTLVAEGTFREDLYYRLASLSVRMPALRERPEDLPGLVDRLLEGKSTALRFVDFPEATQALLRHHQWPGNVRELRNVVERLLLSPMVPELGLLDARPPGVDRGPEELKPLAEAREQVQHDFELRYLRELMRQSSGSISEGARLAGVARQYLQRLLRKHSLR